MRESGSEIEIRFGKIAHPLRLSKTLETTGGYFVRRPERMREMFSRRQAATAKPRHPL
jgi:hypothetical protein